MQFKFSPIKFIVFDQLWENRIGEILFPLWRNFEVGQSCNMDWGKVHSELDFVWHRICDILFRIHSSVVPQFELYSTMLQLGISSKNCCSKSKTKTIKVSITYEHIDFYISESGYCVGSVTWTQFKHMTKWDGSTSFITSIEQVLKAWSTRYFIPRKKLLTSKTNVRHLSWKCQHFSNFFHLLRIKVWVTRKRYLYVST